MAGEARYASIMSNKLTADDLWPLVLKLPHDERVRLAKLTLKAAATNEVAADEAAPPDAAEFGSDDDPLAWEGEGWDGELSLRDSLSVEVNEHCDELKLLHEDISH
jgi:hypothetical protein